MQGKYPLLFGNYAGEILAVTEGSGANGASLVQYDVKVTFTNGSEQILNGVQMSSMFGGIGDTFQSRLLTTKDIQEIDPADYYDDDAHRSCTGARVIVVFLAGHIQFPVITGFLNHPKGVRFYKNHESLKPQSTLLYLGMTFQFGEEGDFQIIHRGAPTVSYATGGGLLGALGAAAGALGGALESDLSATPENPALAPAAEDVWVRMRFGKKGEWRLTDSVGQMIEMDHTKNRIYISNNDLKASDGGDDAGVLQIATNSTDAEYVLLDRDKKLVLINARETAQIYSFGKRKDVTEGDHTHHVLTDEKITVDGDKSDKYGGAWEFTVENDFSPTVSGSAIWAITKDWLMTTDGDTNIAATGKVSISSDSDLSITASSGKFFAEGSGGASLTLTNGTIALKGSQGEVMALIGDILKAILALTVPTSPGGGPSGPPINSSDFVQLQTKFAGMTG